MTTDKIPEPGQERMITTSERITALSAEVAAHLSEIAKSRACIEMMLNTITNELLIQKDACLKISNLMSQGGE